MRRVALFARRPLVGKVKTRLSPALPPEMACMLYRGMLADAVAAVRGSRRAEERFVYWADAGSVGEAEGLAERVQSGGDLGERLTAAFEELIAAPGDQAVILGADCPFLGDSAIDEAFERLEHSPLVIAPARDGGYALVGLARRAPTLFRGIPWSSEHVLVETLERARAAGLEVARLARFEDVDTPEDFCRLVACLAVDRGGIAPATRRALAECGALAVSASGAGSRS